MSCYWHHWFITPSTILHLSEIRSCWQKAKLASLSNNTLKLLLGDPEAFPVQIAYFLQQILGWHSWTCQEDRPNQMPPPLAPFNQKEQQLYSEHPPRSPSSSASLWDWTQRPSGGKLISAACIHELILPITTQGSWPSVRNGGALDYWAMDFTHWH